MERAAARRSDRVLLTESVIDALSVVDTGLLAAMPCHGVGALTEEHLNWLTHSGVRHVVLAFDGEAGRRGMETLQARLTEAGLAVDQLALPEGEDAQRAQWHGRKGSGRPACQRACE